MAATKLHPSQHTTVAFSAYLGGSQSITNATFTKAICDTEVFDSHSCYNTANGRFTPTVEGYYTFNGGVNLAAAGDTGTLHVSIMKNGTNTQWTRNKQSGTGEQAGSVASIQYANGTTDYFEMNVYTNGGTTTMNGGLQGTWFNGARL